MMMIHQIAHASINATGHGHCTKLDIVHNWCLRYLHTEFHFPQTSFGVCICPYEFSECLGRVCANTQIIEHALHLWGELGTAPAYWRKLKLNLDDKTREQSFEFRWILCYNLQMKVELEDKEKVKYAGKSKWSRRSSNVVDRSRLTWVWAFRSSVSPFRHLLTAVWVDVLPAGFYREQYNNNMP